MAVIGLDIGTTGTKALVVDDAGTILAKGYQGYRLRSEGNRVEQDADDWVSASVFAIRECLAQLKQIKIDAISLSTQGGSTVEVDKRFSPMGMAWTWMDSRSAKEVDALREVLGEDYFYQTTGWKLSAAFDAAKILCMKKEKSAAQYMTTLEYVNHFLTGKAVIDPTNAAMRQLFSIRSKQWDKNILNQVGITTEQLPEILPTGAWIGGLCKQAAQKLGLPEGTPVYNGAHDQYCASIGAGATKEGDILLSTGTTWVVMGISRQYLFSDTFIAPGIHPIEGLHGAIASLACSGASLQWYKNNFLSEDFLQINHEIEKRYPEKADLFFYPYLTGANYPLWKRSAKGTFTGFDLSHGKFDFAKAIMEGVVFGLKRALDDFAQNGCPTKQLKIMGGATNSDIWKKIIAAITNVPIAEMKEADTCALGAAMIAAVGTGIYPDYESAAQAMVKMKVLDAASAEDAAYYQGKYARYHHMWACIQPYYV